ncbi:unnamed protein product, partial [Ectocarpus sp. 6 AP-2014]
MHSWKRVHDDGSRCWLAANLYNWIRDHRLAVKYSKCDRITSSTLVFRRPLPRSKLGGTDPIDVTKTAAEGTSERSCGHCPHDRAGIRTRGYRQGILYPIKWVMVSVPTLAKPSQ